MGPYRHGQGLPLINLKILMSLTGSQIRQRFLDYFASKGHRIVHSSSLIPPDETLLFTNAGMNQFKDVFLGVDKRDYSRATTSQKCVRAGGKHNDLENVGFTNRHHTFFEMLGNFSFGDYFKQDAIAYAWELITSKEWFALPKEKLYVTIFQGEKGIARDDEAERYWMDVGVPKERIFGMGMKDNFWAMGDTGPCGPCSEMHYDMGVAASDAGHTDCKFPCECGRYVEIWNLVFMQFDRDASGTLNPLPKPSIDTGMGLERIAAVLQGVISNYETDLFTPLIAKAAELTGMKQDTNDARRTASLRIIADHSRASTFLISDGVLPANEGRGYVLRKILRRGIRHGVMLGHDGLLMTYMVDAVAATMGDAYPELRDKVPQIKRILEREEQAFAHTIRVGSDQAEDVFDEQLQSIFDALRNEDFGIQEIQEKLDTLSRSARIEQALAYLRSLPDPKPELIFPGEKAFKLYDTFGLPLDFIIDAIRDRGFKFDQAGFDSAMQEQREKARASWKGGSKATASPVYRELERTTFEGYSQTASSGCEVLAIVREGAGVQELQAGQEGEIVLDHTPFYADSGGQVGDVGWFYDSSRTVLAEVRGCVMPVQGVRAHRVSAKQPIHVGDRLEAVVNTDVRRSITRNHTATHLLHAALRDILGKHVKQAGSLVDPSKLRFDFSHFTGVADEELQDIEDMVNKEVLKNERVQVIADVPIDVAVNEYKAMALFGEKYGDKVRVIKIGDFSTELCGGIHTGATGEIGLVKLLHESSVSSGVRRLEAITGESSLRHFRQDHSIVATAGELLGTSGAVQDEDAFRRALMQREDEIKKLRRELEQARMKSASASMASASDEAKTVNGIKVLARRVDNLDRGQMRVLVDNLRNKLGSGVVVLGSAQDGKVALIVGVTKDLTARVQAGKIIGEVAKKVGGSGGGRPDMAEAGGKDPEQLDAALGAVPQVVESLTSGS